MMAKKVRRHLHCTTERSLCAALHWEIQTAKVAIERSSRLFAGVICFSNGAGLSRVFEIVRGIIEFLRTYQSKIGKYEKL